MTDLVYTFRLHSKCEQWKELRNKYMHLVSIVTELISCFSPVYLIQVIVSLCKMTQGHKNLASVRTYCGIWIRELFRGVVIRFQGEWLSPVKRQHFGERCCMVLWEHLAVAEMKQLKA